MSYKGRSRSRRPPAEPTREWGQREGGRKGRVIVVRRQRAKWRIMVREERERGRELVTEPVKGDALPAGCNPIHARARAAATRNGRTMKQSQSQEGRISICSLHSILRARAWPECPFSDLSAVAVFITISGVISSLRSIFIPYLHCVFTRASAALLQ